MEIFIESFRKKILMAYLNKVLNFFKNPEKIFFKNPWKVLSWSNFRSYPEYNLKGPLFPNTTIWDKPAAGWKVQLWRNKIIIIIILERIHRRFSRETSEEISTEIPDFFMQFWRKGFGNPRKNSFLWSKGIPKDLS